MLTPAPNLDITTYSNSNTICCCVSVRGPDGVPQPPILTEEFDPETMKPSLTVEGDVMLKEYNILAGEGEEKTLKIARALHDLSEMEDVKVQK